MSTQLLLYHNHDGNDGNRLSWISQCASFNVHCVVMGLQRSMQKPQRYTCKPLMALLDRRKALVVQFCCELLHDICFDGGYPG
jgi:hypothetical protein